MRYTGPIRKVVHHKTVVNSENAKAMYGGTGSWPQFTVGPSGIQQHYDTSVGGRALVNKSGGVQTNSDGVIQIEVVGMPGVSMPSSTMGHLVTLLKWIERTHGIPWVWPNGRPRTTTNGRDPGGHNRSAAGWANAGHFAHSQVPENSHWDTAYTDLEWFVLNTSMAPQAVEHVVQTWKVQPMFNPAVPVVDALPTPDGDGCWLLAADGAVFTTDAAPYLGGMNTSTHFSGRTAARLEPIVVDGIQRYVVVATSGERYVPEAPK